MIPPNREQLSAQVRRFEEIIRRLERENKEMALSLYYYESASIGEESFTVE